MLREEHISWLSGKKDYLAICNRLFLHVSDKGVTLYALPDTLHIGPHIIQVL
jgi:hypothetical protein